MRQTTNIVIINKLRAIAIYVNYVSVNRIKNNDSELSAIPNIQTYNCLKKKFPKSRLTYGDQMVNPRYQIPQGQ